LKSFIPRKDRIILSAIDIIDELGIQGLSTKELASREDIAESALYRHFRSKDQIIEAVVEYFGRYDESIFNTAAKMKVPSKQKVVYYLKSYAEYYENYPAITAILHSYEVLRHEPAIEEKIRSILQSRMRNLIQLVKEAQREGQISCYHTAEELSNIITGYFLVVILDWRMDGCSYSLKKKMLDTFEKMLSYSGTSPE
jgi:AcrR family transcriptional regulator